MGTEPDFRILGPLDVAVDGAARPDLGGPQQRRLLAMLLLHLNRIVPADRIVDGLWASRPPAGADVTLRTHVSHLRRRLAAVGAAGSLVTRPPGYGLFLEPERVDAHRFEGLLGHGQEALGLAQPAQAADLLRRALNQWRGPVLAGLDAPAFAESETARLEELRLVALESRIDADLALGRHHDVIAELERLVAAHPFREGFLGQLMLALYRSGRQVDALAVYSSARDHLADELGLDPGPVLADLETAILRHDPALLPSPAWTAEPGVVRPARVRPPPDALFTLARRVRMVGRSAEWHRLRALWRRVSERDRGVVLISGEAGVGKTRLVAELTHLVAGEGTTLLVARCAQAGSPYHPIASALRGSAEVDDALANAPDAIRARLAPVLDGPPRPAGEELTERDDPAGQPLPLFEAVVWLIRRIADATPVVVVVEDAERIDRSSSLLLRHLVDGLPERVLIVVCFRDPPGSRHAPLLELLGDVGGRGLTERMALRPLTEEGLGTLVTDLVGAAPPDVVRRLWSRTGGNPFFATEMVRDLEGRGELTSGGRWQVPPGVRDVLRHRLRTLAESTRHVVRCAAVLGSEIRFDLLTRITDQGEDLLVESLDDAVAAGFLVESGRSWQVSYAFPHDLMRDAVYADIPVPRRQRLHLRAAQALHGGGPGRRADVITAAVHLRAAGSAADPVQAAQLSLRAADEARRLYAWDEAVAHAEAAVDLLRHADAPAAQQADAAVCAAMFRLKASIGYGRAIEHLEYALERYRTIGDDAALGSVHSRIGGALCTHHSVMDIPRALEHFAAAERLFTDRRTAYHLHRGMTQAAMYGMRTELLGASAQRAAEMSARLDRRDLAVFAGWGLAWFRFNRGELAAADEIRERIWATAHELGDPYLGWVPVNAGALCATGYLDDPARGRAWCRRGLAQSRFDTFAFPHDAVIDQLVLAMATMGEMDAARRAADPLPPDAVSRRLLMFLDGEWEEAERAWAGAVDADEASGDLHDAALNARWLAGARLMLGRNAGAVAALRRALVLGAEGPQMPTELAVRAQLARLGAAAELPRRPRRTAKEAELPRRLRRTAKESEGDDAADHLARCDEILGMGEDWAGQAGTVELARGAVLAAQRNRRRSDAAHEKALEIFSAYHLPWRRADGLDAWARLLMSAGDRDEALAKHRAAAEAYQAIGAAQRWRRPLTSP